MNQLSTRIETHLNTRMNIGKTSSTPSENSNQKINKRTLIKFFSMVGIAPLLSTAACAAHAQAKSNSSLVLAHGTIYRPWFLEIRKTLPATSSGTSAIDIDSVQRAAHWTRQWLKLVVKYQQNPLRAARSISHTQVAMHDAWLTAGIEGATTEERELCAHRAASLVLNHLYPNETPGFFESQYAWIAPLSIKDSTKRGALEALGTQVAQAIINRSLRDGAGRAWPVRDRPKDFPGIWVATYPLYSVNPTEPYAGEWRPWIKPSADRYQSPTAPRPGSDQHRRETLEVLNVVRNLTPNEREAAERWNLDAGSVTPAGVWMQHAIELLLRTPISGNAFEATTAVLTSTSVAMADSFIACWRIKFRDWSERPITAIRRDIDPGFTTPLVTPGFPAYVSGHSTLSGATSAIMSYFWPTEAPQLNAMADEAAMSRLWGGIHFRSDNDEGLRVGRAVGAEVIATLKSPALS